MKTLKMYYLGYLKFSRNSWARKSTGIALRDYTNKLFLYISILCSSAVQLKNSRT